MLHSHSTDVPASARRFKESKLLFHIKTQDMGKRTSGISPPTSDIDIRHQALDISKERTIRKLMRGGGGGRVKYQKNIHAREN